MFPVLIFFGIALLCVVAGAVVIRRRRAVFRSARGLRARTTTWARPRRPRRSSVPAGGLGQRVRALFGGGVSDVTWKELEELLVKADVGPRGSADLVRRVRDVFEPGGDPAEVLRREVVAVLGPDEQLHLAADRLAVILVVGVNGSGKTTTIGKLARYLAGQGHAVSLAASDTFRAAAGEQLEVWAQRSGAHIVAQQRGADPGAVAFDAVTSATARGSDVLIVDTAGRLHTKAPLMDELAKVKRVIEKAGAEVDETLLVLDAHDRSERHRAGARVHRRGGADRGRPDEDGWLREGRGGHRRARGVGRSGPVRRCRRGRGRSPAVPGGGLRRRVAEGLSGWRAS